jgi:hypothetical protein
MIGRTTAVALAFVANAFALSGTMTQVANVHSRTVSRVASPEVKAALRTCSSYPCPAGYFWYYFEDPCAPDSPDTFEAYIEYWNEDESFAYDEYAGHGTYYSDCYPYYIGESLSSAGNYQHCIAESPWNCQDLGWTWNTHP